VACGTQAQSAAAQERPALVSPHKPTAAGISDKKMMESIFAQYPNKRLNEDQFIDVIGTQVPQYPKVP
jgi:hypothetical protein